MTVQAFTRPFSIHSCHIVRNVITDPLRLASVRVGDKDGNKLRRMQLIAQSVGGACAPRLERHFQIHDFPKVAKIPKRSNLSCITK
jgi:hypothetical protein